MSIALGIGFIVFGAVLICTQELSAILHERWNSRFWWTRWATGSKPMRASRIANVVVGIGLIALGLAFLALMPG
jgi:hypothetical protein